MTTFPPIAETYKGLRVLVTGHTGFKGSWLCLWLAEMGADVAGFSDIVPTSPAAFDIFGADAVGRDIRGEITDAPAVLKAMQDFSPDLVFHLAAQPIVRRAVRDPLESFSVNVIGTAAVLEAVRHTPSVRACLVITSDKVYLNGNEGRAFVEDDTLGGHEPYGASKAAAEIIVATYRSAGFHRGAGSPNPSVVATARAGNVIGGGDWAADRLIPDAVRAITDCTPIVIRSPRATRPWQHVLEPLGGYLLFAQRLLLDPENAPPALNFGPDASAEQDVETVVRRFLDEMRPFSVELRVEPDLSGAEAAKLMVDSTLARRTLGWAPAWSWQEAITRIADWHRAHFSGEENPAALARAQIKDYRGGGPVDAFR
ncbi:CDP-glucose 4,6-dehydratase [Rhodobacteraceae bacterium KMM 6894]|nr:CDP-glucose 4,6-dehydratase [Rhodobacteraceae bacterium KMM 6894]